jgi:hypothetical protein
MKWGGVGGRVVLIQSFFFNSPQLHAHSGVTCYKLTHHNLNTPALSFSASEWAVLLAISVFAGMHTL